MGDFKTKPKEMQDKITTLNDTLKNECFKQAPDLRNTENPTIFYHSPSYTAIRYYALLSIIKGDNIPEIIVTEYFYPESSHDNYPLWILEPFYGKPFLAHIMAYPNTHSDFISKVNNQLNIYFSTSQTDDEFKQNITNFAEEVFPFVNLEDIFSWQKNHPQYILMQVFYNVYNTYEKKRNEQIEEIRKKKEKRLQLIPRVQKCSSYLLSRLNKMKVEIRNHALIQKDDHSLIFRYKKLLETHNTLMDMVDNYRYSTVMVNRRLLEKSSLDELYTELENTIAGIEKKIIKVVI